MTISPSDMAGRWRLDRVVDDGRAGHTARFTGFAQLTPNDEFWVYEEAGHLLLPNQHQLKAERRYLWHPVGAGFDIYFDDKRFFHRFDLDVSATAAHWCDPDTYDVAYDLAGWPEWRSTWRVAGPRKDYMMTSTYRR